MFRNVILYRTVNSYTTIVEGKPDGDQYAYKFTGIAPGWMGDTITAELLDGENAVIATKGYSVLQYLNKLKGMTAGELGYSDEKYDAHQVLIDDLLVYGGAAQVFTNHKTSLLVSDGITGSDREPADKNDFKLENDETYVDFTSATVYFSNINRLKIFFNAESIEGLVIKYKIGDSEEWQDIAYSSNGKGGYVIATPGISASNYTEAYTFAAFMEGEEEAGATLTYAFSMKDSSNEAMAYLALATYNYGVSAKAYADAN